VVTIDHLFARVIKINRDFIADSRLHLPMPPVIMALKTDKIPRLKQNIM
jgi:hypothetical protein